MEMVKKPSRSGFYMKTTLKKILFILLFFSAAVPSATQAMGGGEQALLAGADFDQQNGQKALRQAAFDGCLKVVKLLLAQGAKVDMQDSVGLSPLMSAAGNGHLDIVELLLATGKVNINKQANDGSTALMEAAFGGYLKVVRSLIGHKAKVNMQDNDGWSALIYASSSGQPKVAKLLLAWGTKVDMQDNAGWTPLRSAVENGHSEVVEVLLATKKVNVNWRDKMLGWTPLRLAASWENLTFNPKERQEYAKIIDQLIDAQADLWARAKDDTTALKENSKTINKHMRRIIPGILMEVVESELLVVLPTELADLVAKLAYQGLPECELVQ